LLNFTLEQNHHQKIIINIMTHRSQKNIAPFPSKSAQVTFCKIMAVILTVAAGEAFAQSRKSEVEIIQEAFGLEKKAAVAKFMNFSDSAAAFWKIYDEYEVERKKLGKDRIQIIVEYAKNYPNVPDEKLVELFERVQSIKKSSDNLEATYFKKIQKEYGASKAAQFWQLESYFNSIIQANIFNEMPFIGEKLR
jgi:hypothetical protein